MKLMLRLGSITVAIFLISTFVAGQTNSNRTDGSIVEQTQFALPSYEQIPERFKNVYTRQTVDQIKNSTDLELLKIKYLSDGLRVSGFIYKPKNTAGRKIPAVIWNHGMVQEDSRIGIENYNDLYDMFRIALSYWHRSTGELMAAKAKMKSEVQTSMMYSIFFLWRDRWGTWRWIVSSCGGFPAAD